MRKVLVLLVAVLLEAVFAYAAFANVGFEKLQQGHWAYDAVMQLESKGIISPEFKNKREITRYEMAEVISRALSKATESKFDKEDITVLKKLATEFKIELETIGKMVDTLEGKIDKIENGIGSWNLSGTFIFDAEHSREGGWSNNGLPNEWRKEQMYLYLTRRINENTTFYTKFRMGADGAGSEKTEGGRGDISEHMLTHFYVDTNLNDTSLRVGRYGIDFEEEYGFYTDNDAVFGHFRLDGFQLQRQFGKLRATAAIGRNRTTDDDLADHRDLDNFRTHTILDLKYDFNDKFFAGASGYWFIANSAAPDGYEEMNGNTAKSTGADSWNIQTYAGYMSYEFLKGAKFKGIYYRQNLGKTVAGDYKDTPQSWKVILDLDQELLRVGSLWLEYNAHDNNFWNTFPDRYAISGSAHCSVGDNMPYNSEMSKFIFARFERAWSDKIDTGLRFARCDYGTSGIANPYECGAYVTWHFSPVMSCQLIYDYVNYGENSDTELNSGSDNVIQLRTTVEF